MSYERACVCMCVLFKTGRSNKIVFTPSNNMCAVGTESPLLGLHPEADSLVSGPCYKSGYFFFCSVIQKEKCVDKGHIAKKPGFPLD